MLAKRRWLAEQLMMRYKTRVSQAVNAVEWKAPACWNENKLIKAWQMGVDTYARCQPNDAKVQPAR